MPLLIINADDFGYSPGIDHGILDAHSNGILTSATLMSNMPGFDLAVQMAKEHLDLGVGVHLTLTCGAPLCPDVPSLADARGEFKGLSFYEGDFSIDEDELYREWKTQIDRVIDAGIRPDHLDSHHHVNTLPQIRDVFERLAREYGLPVRNNCTLPEDLRATDRFEDLLDRLGSTKAMWRAMSVRNFIEDAKIADSTEAICHPGYIDAELNDRSSFTVGRIYTTRELLRPEYRELLDAAGITLGTYRDLQV